MEEEPRDTPLAKRLPPLPSPVPGSIAGGDFSIQGGGMSGLGQGASHGPGGKNQLPWRGATGERLGGWAGWVCPLSLGPLAAGQHPAFYPFRTKDTPRLSLLLVILGVIFMNGNRVSEGEWAHPPLGGCPVSRSCSKCLYLICPGSCPLGGATQDGTAPRV